MILNLKNITKKYGKRTILSNIDVSFPSHGLVVITGDNGSGKTTLLNIIGLLDSSFEGEIIFNGLHINSKDKRQVNNIRASQINYIFQESNLIDDLTVNQNIKLYKNVKMIEKDTNELFSNEMSHFRNKYPGTLSGGERQKIAIKRGLLHGNVLLCDEPVASLDYESTIEVMEKLREISKTKLVIIVMHARDLINHYADRIIELKNGSIDRDEVINSTEEQTFTQQKAKVTYKKSLFTLMLSFFKKRKFKAIMYTFLLVLTNLSMALSLSLVLYDAPASVAKQLVKENSMLVMKQINVVDPFYDDMVNNLIISQGKTIYESVVSEFNDEQINYLVHSQNGDVTFTSSLNLAKNEALVDIDIFSRLTLLDHFIEGKTIEITNASLGITSLKLDIIGISTSKGIYASKDTLVQRDNSKYASFPGGLFVSPKVKNPLMSYLNNSPVYIQLTFYQSLLRIAGYDESLISTLKFEYDQVGMSRALYQMYFDANLDEDIRLQFLDLPDTTNIYLKDSFIPLRDSVYPNGAELACLLPTRMPLHENEYFENYIVVSDEAYADIVKQLPTYDFLSISITPNNARYIAEVFLKNDYIFKNNQAQYAAGLKKDIVHAYKVIIPIFIAFSLASLMIYSLLTSTILLTKRNEIGLLQSFGFSKVKSLLPTILVSLTIGVFSLILTAIFSPQIFNVINNLMFSMNHFGTKAFVFSPVLFILIIAIHTLLFMVNFLFNYGKIRKFNPKDIFKFN